MALVASLMFFASCTGADYSGDSDNSDDSSEILGTWYCIDEDGTKITLQFFSDGDGAFHYIKTSGKADSGKLTWRYNSSVLYVNLGFEIDLDGEYYLVGENLVCKARSYSRTKPNGWDSDNTGGGNEDENPYMTKILGKWTGMVDDDELEYTMEFKANGIMEESYTYDGEYSWDSLSYTISGSTLILDESSIMNNIYGTDYTIMSLTSSKLVLKTDFNDILTFNKQ